MFNLNSILSIFAINPARFGVVMLILATVYPAAYIALKEITGVDPFGAWAVAAGLIPFLVMSSPFALLVSFRRAATRLFTPISILAILAVVNAVAGF